MDVVSSLPRPLPLSGPPHSTILAVTVTSHCLLTPALVTLEPSLSKAARLVLLNESQIMSPTLTGLMVA